MDESNGPESPAPSAEPPAAPQRGQSFWIAIGLLVLVALVVTNVLLIDRVSDLERDLEASIAVVDSDVRDLAASVGDVSSMVDDVESQLVAINALALAGSNTSSLAPDQGTTDQGSAVGAGLPRFDETVPDPALGLQISGLDGPEYYSGQNISIDAADGKARAWMVWAHWCPYCQQEMPGLKAWVDANSAAYPDFELVSVTTAIDEARGNPLVPYLDELQLPFPVIVDADGSLSDQLGLSAFPFWVFTGPDGAVLGRSAGLLGPEQFASIAAQLQDIASA